MPRRASSGAPRRAPASRPSDVPRRYRRDGGQLVAACLDGALHVWETSTATLVCIIDAVRDLERSDRFLGTPEAKRARRPQPYFNTVAYSADGESVLAGGVGRFVCV